MKKQKLTIEYHLSCTSTSLFRALSTPEGLEVWFADRVSRVDDVFEFFWKRSSQKALLMNMRENNFVRFRWLDDENYYFEFRISRHELTRDISLIITDFASDSESQEVIDLWNEQIQKLKRAIGCAKK